MTDEALEYTEAKENTDKAVAFDALVARAASLGHKSVTAALDALAALQDDR